MTNQFVLASRRTFVLFSTFLLSAAPTLAGISKEVSSATAAAAPGELTILHFTDTHISPHHADEPTPAAYRGQATIDWLKIEAGKPQQITATRQAPAPDLAIVTGDLTEYGVIDDTWAQFERAFAGLPMPMYVTPGNHDNTWVAMFHVMRERHGAEHYAIDKDGYHIACLNSASPQSPVPMFDARARAWLKADLDKQPPGTPVIIAFHHPLDDSLLANPVEVNTFVDLILDYNVIVLLYGHGHAPVHRVHHGVDGVMGGSTFGRHAGYGVLHLKDGQLTYAYHKHNAEGKQNPAIGKKNGGRAKEWTTLLHKRFSTEAPGRMFEIGDLVLSHRRRNSLLVELAARDGAHPLEQANTRDAGFASIDGRPLPTPTFMAETQHHRMRANNLDLLPGEHVLTIEATWPDGSSDIRTKLFHAPSEQVERKWQRSFPAAFKAAPVVLDHLLLIAGTDGVLRACDRSNGRDVWSLPTGAEILGAPAVSKAGVIIFGNGEGKIMAVNREGQSVWQRRVEAPTYAPPLLVDGVVYVGDNSGRMHALDAVSGKPVWTFRRAAFAIESRAVALDDMIAFGAWDGYLYAVDRASGKLRWKSLGPKSSEAKAIRYYGPADCPPVAIKHVLHVCDRGYLLGHYSIDGKMEDGRVEGVAAIAGVPNRDNLILRTLGDGVQRMSPEGSIQWSRDVPTGRVPVPPTVHGDAVYVCSNLGLLSVLDLQSGAVRWQYRVTPGFYVLAPIAVDDEGVVYAAGMDGKVTALSPR